MRLINADALIQSLEKKHEHWHELVTEENKEIEFAHSYALNVIRNAPTISEDWIPCSERLPEKDELVLVTVWNGVSIAWRNIYGGWESAEDMYEKGDVTAWMPLPTPYKGGDDK